jgi:type III restriction enzyme
VNKVIRQINQRMSLRKPQQLALDALHQIVEKLPMKLDVDPKDSLRIIQELFPNIGDFERDFPNICLALATGVGKTRLMGAMISYLALTKGIRNFFVLAPNNTITEKLVREFSKPLDPKYIFKGMGELISTPIRIVTADNYDHGFGVRNAWAKQQNFLKGDEIHVNIFNIAMIHSQKKGDHAPRIKRPRETIRDCLSYFDYLAQVEDLVVIMDEAHHYRASAAFKAINELKPILGIELTATPQVEVGGKSIPFRNVIYHYPLSAALDDGLVKQPWVAGRENFDSNKYDEKALEKIKMEDGVRIHESTKIHLLNYASDNDQKPIKPFMLIIAQNKAHANEIEKTLKDDDFFGGSYKNKIRVIYSSVKVDEEERMIKDLLEVESFDNPTEIVIHVNMLKEGWDVNNLYTIVPLRAANSKTLIEQSLGRGLRLPFGKRTGIVEIDRLTIVSHDRFKEIVDEAKKTDSLIRAGILIGKDIPLEGMKSIEVRSKVAEAVQALPDEERFIAEKVLACIDEVGSNHKEEIITRLTDEADDKNQKDVLRAVCTKVHELQEELSISIPRIVVQPMEVTPGKYSKFSLDLRNVHPQSFTQSLLLQNLSDGSRQKLITDHSTKLSESPQKYIAMSLLDKNDVAETEEHISVVNDVSDQMVAHLKGYLKKEEELHSVIINYRDMLVNLIHAQMQLHYSEPTLNWDVTVERNYTIIKSARYAIPAEQNPIHYDHPIDQKSTVKDFLFTGFKRSCFSSMKFHSEPELTFAKILEQDELVIKWVKPSRGAFQIFYHKDIAYEPDFVVESEDRMFLVEIKRRCDLEDLVVKKKGEAAVLWCSLATNHAKKNHGKPWSYLLIPDDVVDITMTLEGIASRFTCHQNKHMQDQ